MFLTAINRRLSKFAQMITQSSHFVVYCPVVNDKSHVVRNPNSVSLKVRCFHASKLTNNPQDSNSLSIQSSSNVLGSRFSRSARTEAQDVLFDYLHGTRNFSYTDAEHISKNSPHFLKILLSRIDSNKDVVRSLSKFLRYHPINEFEPFLESLGLRPSELPSMLPRQLMFLSDDQVLLENYQVLCNYGIPRSKIGKMYKEAREIFCYDQGTLAMKLRAYENLGLSKTTVIKLVICCPSLLIGGVDANFVKVLEKVSRLGVKNDLLGGYLSGKHSYSWKRMCDVLDFLEEVGYHEERLLNLFKANPTLVFEGSGKRVYVLFGLLLKLGLNTNDVCSLIIQNQQILSSKSLKNFFHAMDFLFNIGMRVEDVVVIVSTHTDLLCSCTLKGPKTVCSELKVKREELCKIIRKEPMKLFTLASKSNLKTIKQSGLPELSTHRDRIAFLLRLGYVENSDEMTKALKQFRGRGDQLQERFDCLVEAGLDSNVVTGFIKQAPMVLNQSKDVIEKKIDRLTKLLGYPIESVVGFPAFLCYDMERINRRFKMYAWLREKGAVKPRLSLSTILACSDTRFVKYFVDVHPDGSAMWEALRNH